MSSQRDAEAILALEAATRALLSALRQDPEPDLDAAAAALAARRAALTALADTDPRTRSSEQAARLAAILEQDIEAGRRIEAEMSSVAGRLRALTALRERMAGQPGADPSGGEADPRPSAEVSMGEAARAYGSAPTPSRSSRKPR